MLNIKFNIFQVISMISSTTKIRVRYADTDQLGFVYYANYVVWFECGRTELLREIGFPYSQMEKEKVFIRLNNAINNGYNLCSKCASLKSKPNCGCNA